MCPNSISSRINKFQKDLAIFKQFLQHYSLAFKKWSFIPPYVIAKIKSIFRTFSQKISFLLQNNIEFIYLKVTWPILRTNSNKGHFHTEIFPGILKKSSISYCQICTFIAFLSTNFPKKCTFS